MLASDYGDGAFLLDYKTDVLGANVGSKQGNGYMRAFRRKYFT